jgi:threonine dehydratase
MKRSSTRRSRDSEKESEIELPTFEDVISAREFIAPHLPPTPLVRSESLSRLLGCEYFVKCESMQPVGAFKVRGGVNLVGRLSASERQAGVISASTGNHGQSIAYAGRLFDVPVVIYAPEENPNEFKLEAMRALGAEVRLYGRDFDEARTEVERVAAAEGMRYIHSANEAHLISGVGTIGLEIIDALEDVDVVITPVGAGSCACGTALAVKRGGREGSPVQVIGVQAAAAPAVWQAWKQGNLEVTAEMRTVHEGLATRVPFAMPLRIMWRELDDFVLVSDSDIEAAIRMLAQQVRLVAEGAGAVSLAGAMLLRERLAGLKVVGVLSGGNLPLERYADILKR